MSAHPDSVLCPQCQASIPVNPGYINWCDQCEWNVYSDRPIEFPSFLDKINRKFGERYSEQLFSRVMESASSLKPDFSLSRILAYLLASLVHAMTLIFAIGGILLLIFGWPNFFAIIAGLLSLGFAWGARPRFGLIPDRILPRDDYPELYAFVQRIAGELGLQRIEGIAVDHDFNASFHRIGVRGHVYITIGLPLFSILTPDEQVALLGHEVAHGVNGDVQRFVVINTAVQALAHWDYLLRPNSLFGTGAGRSSIYMLPFNIIMLGLASVVRLGEYSLVLLLFRDSQRAEYLADQLATRVAGGDAMIAMLEKLYFDGSYRMALQRTALNEKKNLFEELNSAIAAMPDREKERIRRMAQRVDSRVDSTHPPTPYRTKFIQRHGLEVGRHMLSDQEGKDVLRELKDSFEAMQKVAVDEYRSTLYR